MINWEAFGLRIGDMLGWEFSILKSDETFLAYQPANGQAIVVRSPVRVCVSKGHLHLESVPGMDLVAVMRNWTEHIYMDGDQLVFDVPIHLLPGSRVLVAPPPHGENGGNGLENAATVVTTPHDDANPAIRVVLQLKADDLVIDALAPIAMLVPATMPGGGGIYSNQETLTSPPVMIGPADPPQDAQPQPQQSLPSSLPQPETVSAVDTEAFTLRVWRLHPNGVRIVPAEKTLMGDAPIGAVKWCGPFVHANSYGFWLFPPVDMDVMWHGGRNFEYNILTPYENEEYPVITALQTPDDKYRYAPRAKLDVGKTIDSVLSIWTGCIFQTPPGWCLMIRSPINVGTAGIFRIQEGILETDWMPYDIWMNLQFLQQGKWVQIRKDSYWPPIAQIIPVRREGYDGKWRVEERMIERTTPEGKDLFERWLDYNYQKWVVMNKKEPATYNRQRAQAMKRINPGASPGADGGAMNPTDFFEDMTH